MEVKNPKMKIGVAVMVLALIAKEVINKKRIKEFKSKINNMNKSMKVFVDAHNALAEDVINNSDEIDKLVEYEIEDIKQEENYCINERLNKIEEEIGTVYEHIAEIAIEEIEEETEEK